MSETALKLEEWARKMGYTGAFPNSEEIKLICNPSTSFIWEQVVEKVKPREEIQEMRQAIVINQLNNTKNKKRVHTIDEVAVYEKKEELKAKVNRVKHTIKEGEIVLNNMKEQANLLMMKNEAAEQEINENEEKSYLYALKTHKLHEEVIKVDEKIELCNELTPIEDDQANMSKITNDLNECIRKLEVIEQENREMFDVDCNVHLNVKENDETLGLLNESDLAEMKYPCDVDFDFYLNRLNSNAQLKQEIKRILMKFNRNSIIKVIEKQQNDCLEKVNKLARNFQLEIKLNDIDEAQSDFSDLHAIHIQSALEAIQIDQANDDLERQIDVENERIRKIVKQTGMDEEQQERILRYMNLEAEVAAYEVTIRKLQENGCDSKDNDNYDDLMKDEREFMQLTQQMDRTIRQILIYFDLLEHIKQRIVETQADSAFCIKKLHVFVDDFLWIHPLTKQLISKELETFSKFDLNYNRQFTYTNKTGYLRNSTNPFISLNAFSEKELFIVGNVLNRSNILPENFLLYLVHNFMQLQTFKSIKKLPFNHKQEKYSWQDLSKQESYLQYAFEKFHQIVNGRCAKDSYSKFTEIMQIWMEMPFKDFIPSTITYKEQTYEHFMGLYKRSLNVL